jgi:hypothetical protein
MSAYTAQYYDPSEGLPIPAAAGGKGSVYPYAQYPSYYNSNDSYYSVSPPEGPDASVMSSDSGVASYGHSGYSLSTGGVTGSYAASSASHADYDSAMSVSGIDVNEYMQDRFAETFNPLPLDHCTVKQAQT